MPRPQLINRGVKHRARQAIDRRRRFAERYVVLREKIPSDGAAARQAAIDVGYSPLSARHQGNQLLNHPQVKALIAARVQRHLQKAEVNGAAIMRYWYDIAMCELPLPPAGPCRYCWGEDHQYQYTQAEYRTAMRKHTSEQLKKSPHLRVPFDDLGGIGFDKTKKPHPHCPECNGEGRNYVMVIDRDKLSPAQKMAIDEVRVHKDGSVSLKMRDRSRAMENLQQLMGMIQPRKPLEVLDPQRPIEENVDIVLQTAIDQGLLTTNAPPSPLPVLEHDDATSEQLAGADAS